MWKICFPLFHMAQINEINESKIQVQDDGVCFVVVVLDYITYIIILISIGKYNLHDVKN